MVGQVREKVYDCVTYNGEDLLLNLRLNILDPYVDRFVVVEGNKTFTGQPKSLDFDIDRFARFADKIVYVPVDDFPPNPKTARIYERFQRDAISRGLGDAEPNDIIMVSDVDEIPRPELISEFRDGVGVFLQNLYYFKFNFQCVAGEEKCFCTRITRFRRLKTPQALRDIKGRKKYPWWRLDKTNPTLIQNGGWHFSYLMSPEEIAQKIKSFSHEEFNTEEMTDVGRIESVMAAGGDLFGRPGFRWKIVPVDDTFPAYFREHIAEYEEWLAPVPA